MPRGSCLIANEPDGLREKLIEGRVQGKSWKEIGEEHGTGSPGATRAAFKRLTGSEDFKTKGPAIRTIVDGLKDGQTKVIGEAVRTVKVGRAIPKPEPPKVSPGRTGAKPRGTRNVSDVWKEVRSKGKMTYPKNLAKEMLDEVLDIPEMGIADKLEVIVRPGKSATIRGDFHAVQRVIRGNPNRGNAPATFLHEFGHYLDNVGFGYDVNGSRRITLSGARFATEELQRVPEQIAVALNDVMEAIEDSFEMRYNRANLRGTRLHYVTSRREEFARAFNQYITDTVANHMGSVPEGVDGVRMVARIQHNYILEDARSKYQWRDENFGAIRSAFDNLFRELGWLRE